MEGLDNRQHNIPVPSEPAAPHWNSRRSLPVAPEFTAADCEELRFTLKELFLATTIAAVMLALFRSVGIFGAVFSFLSAVIATLLVIPRIFPKDLPRQRLFFDFVWGMVMPIVCLVFDPFLFKHGDFKEDPLLWIPQQQPASVQISKLAYYAWPLLAGQIVTLGMVLTWGKSLRPIAPLIAGTLCIGFVVALCLGIFLALFAAAGTLLFGIGLLGFTPLFTFRAYYRRMRLMWLVAGEKGSHQGRLALGALGIILCLVFAWFTGTMALTAVPPEPPPPKNLFIY